jgi:hypothetical protein
MLDVERRSRPFGAERSAHRKLGDADGVTSTADVVLPVGPSDEADPKHSTNRSSHARRQGVARVTAVARERQAGDLRRLQPACPRLLGGPARSSSASRRCLARARGRASTPSRGAQPASGTIPRLHQDQPHPRASPPAYRALPSAGPRSALPPPHPTASPEARRRRRSLTPIAPRWTRSPVMPVELVPIPPGGDTAHEEWKERYDTYPGFDDDYLLILTLRTQVDANHRKAFEDQQLARGSKLRRPFQQWLNDRGAFSPSAEVLSNANASAPGRQRAGWGRRPGP